MGFLKSGVGARSSGAQGPPLSPGLSLAPFPFCSPREAASSTSTRLPSGLAMPSRYGGDKVRDQRAGLQPCPLPLAQGRGGAGSAELGDPNYIMRVADPCGTMLSTSVGARNSPVSWATVQSQAESAGLPPPHGGDPAASPSAMDPPLCGTHFATPFRPPRSTAARWASSPWLTRVWRRVPGRWLATSSSRERYVCPHRPPLMPPADQSCPLPVSPPSCQAQR